DADGGAICLDGDCRTFGFAPPEADVRLLADRISGRPDDFVHHTDRLAEQYPEAERFRERASGVLAVRLSKLHPNYLMWFRRERVRTVNWAGNPHKPATA